MTTESPGAPRTSDFLTLPHPDWCTFPGCTNARIWHDHPAPTDGATMETSRG